MSLFSKNGGIEELGVLDTLSVQTHNLFRYFKSQNLRPFRSVHLPLLIIASGPLFWFRNGWPIKGVDSYFHIHPQTLLASGYYAWSSELTTGAASISNGAYVTSLQSILSHILPQVLVQALILEILAISAVYGMYLAIFYFSTLSSRLDTSSQQQRSPWIFPDANVNTDVYKHRSPYIASLIISLFWVSNPFALSFVWWHQLLIQVTWALFPWLLVLILRAGRWQPSKIIGVGIILGVLGRAGFTEPYLPEISVALLGFTLAVVALQGWSYKTAERIILAAVSFLVGVASWLLPELPLLQSGIAAVIHNRADVTSPLAFNSQFSTVANVVSLTGFFTLHLSYYGVPYNSWSPLVLRWPGKLLKFLIPSLSLIGLGFSNFRKDNADRRLLFAVLVLTVLLILGIYGSAGTNSPFAHTYLKIAESRFGAYLRSPVDRFIFVLVVPLLFSAASGISWILKSFSPKIAKTMVAIIVIILSYLGSPWWIGTVIPSGSPSAVGSSANIPSGHYQVPADYAVIGSRLAKETRTGSTEVLPYSTTGQVALRWSLGIQTNTDCLFEDYNPSRTTLCTSTGVALSDRVGQYLNRGVSLADPNIFSLARLFGVDTWIVHNDWNTLFSPPRNLSPTSANSFLSSPSNSPTLSRTLTASEITNGISPKIGLLVKAGPLPPSGKEILESGAGFEIGEESINQSRNSPIAFFIQGPSGAFWSGSSVIPLGKTASVQLLSIDGTIIFRVDGVPQKPEGNGTFLRACHAGPLFGECRYPQLSQSLHAHWKTTLSPLIIGSLNDCGSGTASSGICQLNGAYNIKLAKWTPNLVMYNQNTVPVLYSASMVNYLSHVTFNKLIGAAESVANRPNPAIAPLIVPDISKNTITWHRLNPATYKGTISYKEPGYSFLVFNNTFSSRWKLELTNNAKVVDHVLANGFGNGWLIRGKGASTFKLYYAPAQTFVLGEVISGSLLILGMTLLASPFVRRNLSGKYPT